MNIRDRRFVERMERYCKEIMGASERFGHSKEKFMSDYLFYNSCCMSLFQIGELSKRLSDDFRLLHTELPWQEMRSIRNVFAHEYEAVNKESLWETIEKDVPLLSGQLENIQEKEKRRGHSR